MVANVKALAKQEGELMAKIQKAKTAAAVRKIREGHVWRAPKKR